MKQAKTMDGDFAAEREHRGLRHVLSTILRALPARRWEDSPLFRVLGAGVGAYVVIIVFLSFWWSVPPAPFDPENQAMLLANTLQHEELVRGFVTAATVTRVADTLLEKRGGYLRNDKLPPGVFLDNMPSWEYGVVVALRDVAMALRNDFSRSQSQSLEDPDLEVAQPQFNFNADAWILPSTENQYRIGINAMKDYMVRLMITNSVNLKPEDAPAQFFARADNLRSYMQTVEKRLGDYSQRLSAAVGRVDFATTKPRSSSTAESPSGSRVKAMRYETPWLQIDNEFYEAKGYAWAQLHILEALEYDFRPVLEGKNAEVSMLQIIRELRQAITEVYSPIVLNGGMYGIFANYSLEMASYLARADAAALDIRSLLIEG